MVRKLLVGGAAAVSLLAALPAAAADVAAGATLDVAPVPAFTWGGLYIGAHLGGAWSEYHYDIYLPAPTLFGRLTSNRTSSVIGGGQIGYNWQFGRFVFGIEGDLSGKSLKAGDSLAVLGAPALSAGGDTRWQGSVRARSGVAFGRFLLYGTGGWTVSDTTVTICNPFGCGSNAQALDGYTVGGGGEFALTNNVSLGVEYRYSELSRANFDLGTAFGAPVTADASLKEHQVTGRLNFKFGGPVQP